jgi:hypothetical protein
MTTAAMNCSGTGGYWRTDSAGMRWDPCLGCNHCRVLPPIQSIDSPTQQSRYNFVKVLMALPFNSQKQEMKQLVLDWLDWNEQSPNEEFISRVLKVFEDQEK